MDLPRLSRLQIRDLRLAHFATVYLALVALAETATVYAHPVLGIVGYSALLGILTLHAGRTEDAVSRAFLLAITLVPLSRIVALGMPDDVLPDEWRFLMASPPLLVAGFIAVRVAGLSRRSIQLQFPTWRMLPAVIIVACTGVLIGAAMYEYSLLRPSGTASSFDAEDLVEASLVFALITGVTEEIIFRGIVQTSGIRVFGTRVGIAYASVLYGVLFVGHRSGAGAEFVALDILFVFAVALYFGVAAQWTRSLAGVILAHSLITATLLVGIPLLWE